MSIYPGVSQICTPCRWVHLRYPCISVHPPLLINNVFGARARASWERHFDVVIEPVWRCTLRPRSSELRDALGGRDRARLEMQLETEIEWTQRCSLRPRASELIDALVGHDRASLEMHFEALTERVWRCTISPWSSEFGDALLGRDRARLEEYLEVVDLEAVDREGGGTAAETLLIAYLVIVGM